ncbi:head-tail connector protein [Bacillus cereus]|nr:head-tail connector protein [Bacillus cereus]
MILDDIKRSLRVSHNALDSDISDLIEEARHDLMLSGVSSIKVKDDTDPLIKRAIKTYCKVEFTADAKESERFQASYSMLKNHLTLAGDYK